MRSLFLLALTLSACSPLPEAESFEVTGRVVGAQTRQPVVANLSLSAQRGQGRRTVASAETGPDGRFYLYGELLPSDDGVVTIRPTGKVRYPLFENAQQPAYFEEVVSLSRRLTLLGDVELRPTAGLAVGWNRTLATGDTLKIRLSTPGSTRSDVSSYQRSETVTGDDRRSFALWVVEGDKVVEVDWVLRTSAGEQRQGQERLVPAALDQSVLILTIG